MISLVPELLLTKAHGMDGFRVTGCCFRRHFIPNCAVLLILKVWGGNIIFIQEAVIGTQDRVKEAVRGIINSRLESWQEKGKGICGGSCKPFSGTFGCSLSTMLFASVPERAEPSSTQVLEVPSCCAVNEKQPVTIKHEVFLITLSFGGLVAHVVACKHI